MAFVGFNAKNMPPPTPRPEKELLPIGTKRRAYIFESEEKIAKSGSFYLLYSILDETRQTWRYIVMTTGNENAVAMGLQKHSALALACGIINFTDSSELHNREFEIVIGIEPAKDGYPAKNIIKYINPLSGGKPPVVAARVGNSIIDDEIPF